MEVIHLDLLKDGIPWNFSGIIHFYFYEIKDSVSYFKNGKFHREDGPACLELINGTKYWYLDGRRFKDQQEWFEALTSEQKEKALWSEALWK